MTYPGRILMGMSGRIPERSPEGLTQQEAWDVVLDNMGLVKKVTDRFTRRYSSREFDEYLSMASIGAMKAVMTWDSSKASKLSSWMWRIITNELQSASLAESRQVGIVTEDREFTQYEISTDFVPPDGEDQESMSAVVAASEESFEEELVQTLSDARDWEKVSVALVTELTPQEQDIIERHFFQDESFREVGEAIGLSGQRAHQIYTRALRKLRRVLEQDAPPASDGSGDSMRPGLSGSPSPGMIASAPGGDV